MIPTLALAGETDSILNIIKDSNTSEKVTHYLKLSEINMFNDAEISKEYAYTALKLAEQTQNDSLIFASKVALATSLHRANQLDSAAIVLTEVLKEIDEKKYANLYFRANNQLGVTFGKYGKFDIALRYFTKADAIKDQIKDSLELLSLDNNLGNVFLRTSDVEYAKQKFLDVVDRAKALNNIKFLKIGISNLAQAYSMSGKIDSAQNLMLYNFSLFKDDSSVDLTIDYLNYALLWKNIGNIDSADYYFSKTIESSFGRNDIRHRLVAKLYRYNLLNFKDGNLSEIEKDLNYILDSAGTLGLLEVQTFAARTMVNLYELLNQNYKAKEAVILYYALKDSLGFIHSRSEIAAIKAEWENKYYKNQLEVKDLALKKQSIKEQYFWLVLVLVLLICLILAIFLFSHRKMIKKLERQNKEIEEKNKQLQDNNSQISHQNNEIETMVEDLKGNKDRLENLLRQKDTFTSVFTHQLTNQVQAVLMSAEALYYGKNKPKEFTDKFSEIVFSSANHLRNMLVNLIEWSRTQGEYIKLNPNYFQLKEVIERNISNHKQQILNKNITIIKSCEEHAVYADKAMIDTVIKNLLSNAIKYSNEGDSIDISCTVIDTHLVMTIKDNGVGIAEDKLPKLFNITTRVLTKGTQGELGTGLGLSICKELLILNSGKIEIETEEGKGTIIKVFLPTIN